MEPLKSVISRVLASFNPDHAPASDTEEAERWLDEALLVAVIERSTHIAIRERGDALEGLILSGGGANVPDACNGRMRLLEKEHMRALLDLLQTRADCLRPIDMDVSRGYGSYSENVDGRQVRVDIFVNGADPEPHIDLRLNYEPT